jgi:glycosyltransferase involved in cell wall biosynthesis
VRIGIAVQGRFYAFDLARALLQRGADVMVYTNYPPRIAARFGLPAARVRGLIAHGVAVRAADRLRIAGGEPALHRWFGRWAARQMTGQPWTATHVFSGVAEEWLSVPGSAEHCALARASAHIREQRRLLDEEEQRVGMKLDKPSDWMIEREEREYARAGSIVVLSRFALESFVQRGVAAEKLRLMPLATEAHGFAPSDAVVRARIDRVQARRSLRVLYVGAISYQKGMYDLARVIDSLPADRFEFKLVGPIAPECRAIAKQMRRRSTLTGKVAQALLPAEYAWGDLFLAPSIQDGFGVVLSQAAAAGLPVIASTHGAGPDLLAMGVQGWSVPPRDPERTIQLLTRLEGDRGMLADRLRAAREAWRARTWLDVADDFIDGVTGRLGR